MWFLGSMYPNFGFFCAWKNFQIFENFWSFFIFSPDIFLSWRKPMENKPLTLRRTKNNFPAVNCSNPPPTPSRPNVYDLDGFYLVCKYVEKHLGFKILGFANIQLCQKLVEKKANEEHCFCVFVETKFKKKIVNS